MTIYLLLFGSYGLVLWAALSDKRTSLSFVHAADPRQRSSLGSDYCLRFETSLFVSSSDSQGHGGGIRPRLHTGKALDLRMTLFYKFQAAQI
jgi:hypothetical protein